MYLYWLLVTCKSYSISFRAYLTRSKTEWLESFVIVHAGQHNLVDLAHLKTRRQIPLGTGGGKYAWKLVLAFE